MITKYLIRLDDACPTMAKDRWQKIEYILDKYSIYPMVGVIPANQDHSLVLDEEDCNFWNKVKTWQKKGWSIALHGYDHIYCSNKAGVNPIHNRSEFAGLPLNSQKKKIKAGVDIFLSHGIYPLFFFAPSHTFDENTLIAIKDCSTIRMISDTPAFAPYKKSEFFFFPQQFGTFRKIFLPGYWTFCFHPNAMSDTDFDNFEAFIKKNVSLFVSFSDVDVTKLKSKTFLDRCYASFYYFYRKIRNL
ncbi:DUF2334 domain-containing protein [Bacteroides fragilis]|uniref:DUF2334 domain-containing protein n=1 Tax=Bacteroides TaxID=816 RepID=UPI00202F2400|nr:DUF2334 domain-containing protein [Bacteroides fragilis]MCM0220079.1 DUF2334 domain-containing protein [Bacteroides fragilis]MCM0236863.1 DUF2334 domain-containing protein [Bacteroides fragilis]MCM0265826.1 DUF2334 domain-containing protein [Bacteroides fragilis]